jgi:hypothetical protein
MANESAADHVEEILRTRKALSTISADNLGRYAQLVLLAEIAEALQETNRGLPLKLDSLIERLDALGDLR